MSTDEDRPKTHILATIFVFVVARLMFCDDAGATAVGGPPGPDGSLRRPRTAQAGEVLPGASRGVRPSVARTGECWLSTQGW